MSDPQVAAGHDGLQSGPPPGVPDSEAPEAPAASELLRARVERLGVVPLIRVSSAEWALFVAETVVAAGIPIVEIGAAVPGALDVVSHLVKQLPEALFGVGGVSKPSEARRFLKVGAGFLATEWLHLEVARLAAESGVLVFSGALTPTEIIAAADAGSDFVRVSPCDAMGGANYIRSVKAAVPQARLIAAGGVTQLNAHEFIRAGASAIAVGPELFPDETVWMRQGHRIHELARRFQTQVTRGRASAGVRLHPRA